MANLKISKMSDSDPWIKNERRVDLEKQSECSALENEEQKVLLL